MWNFGRWPNANSKAINGNITWIIRNNLKRLRTMGNINKISKENIYYMFMNNIPKNCKICPLRHKFVKSINTHFHCKYMSNTTETPLEQFILLQWWLEYRNITLCGLIWWLNDTKTPFVKDDTPLSVADNLLIALKLHSTHTHRSNFLLPAFEDLFPNTYSVKCCEFCYVGEYIARWRGFCPFMAHFQGL